MAEVKKIRLNKVLREFNISLDRAVEFLSSKGHDIEARPTTKISDGEYQVLFEEFQTDKSKKVQSKEVGEEKRKEKEELRLEREREIEERQKRKAPALIKAESRLVGTKQVGRIDLGNKKAVKVEKVEPPVKEEKVAVVSETKVAEIEEEKIEEQVVEAEIEKPKAKSVEKEVKVEAPKVEAPKVEAPKVEVKVEAAVAKATTKIPAKKETKKPVVVEEAEDDGVPVKVETKYKKLNGPNFTGQKIDLTQFKKPEKKKPEAKVGDAKDKKSKRRRISKEAPQRGRPETRSRGPQRKPAGAARTTVPKEEPSEEEVQRQVRETLEKLQGKSSQGKGAKSRRDKRDSHRK